MSATRDPFEALRSMTPARVGLGRSGDALPTRAVLDFSLDHARARDAVWAELDTDALRIALGARFPDGSHFEVREVRSAACDRSEFLQRPDLGAQLDARDAARLARSDRDIAVVLADGLSAHAVQAHAVPTLVALVEALGTDALAPLTIARQARVALGDPIGAALGARLSVVLIGERPGLSSPDSLGAYLTYGPRPGRSNAERNCVSNIRPEGLPPEVAGARIGSLAREALRLQISGIALKDRDESTTLERVAHAELPAPVSAEKG